jgi:hypothetical protein
MRTTYRSSTLHGLVQGVGIKLKRSNYNKGRIEGKQTSAADFIKARMASSKLPEVSATPAPINTHTTQLRFEILHQILGKVKEEQRGAADLHVHTWSCTGAES